MSYCNRNNDGTGLAVFIILSPIIPAGLIGYWIGASVYDIVLVRWGLALIFAGLDIILYFLAVEKWGVWGFFGLYFGQWIFVDMVYSVRMDTPLVTLTILEKLLSH